MEPLSDKITIAFLGLATAAAVALFVTWVALYDFGLSGQEIRSGALIGVILIASALGFELFGKKRNKRK